MSKAMSDAISKTEQSRGSRALRVSAAIFGSFFATVCMTVSITLAWPFGDKVEQIFAGGVFFFVFWAGLFYWALLAYSAKIAWLRMLALIIGFSAFNGYHLFLAAPVADSTTTTAMETASLEIEAIETEEMKTEKMETAGGGE